MELEAGILNVWQAIDIQTILRIYDSHLDQCIIQTLEVVLNIDSATSVICLTLAQLLDIVLEYQTNLENHLSYSESKGMFADS